MEKIEDVVALEKKVNRLWSECQPLIKKGYHDPDNFSKTDGIMLEAYCQLYESAQARLKRYRERRKRK
tara:strand:+ start:860 stop:1063 length:204 start_codon:yes stop_codon:yes gene_type:complete